ncbi:MAG: ABC transporter ATP-binding protein [Ilumatobacteraceae bacterium]
MIADALAASELALDVANLTVEYAVGRHRVRAVDDVSFHVATGETLALIGESGSGKSSIGKGIMRLAPVVAGRARLGGVDMASLSGRRLRQHRSVAQMVFQDPHSALDPRRTIGENLLEPLRSQHRLDRPAMRRAWDLYERTGLPGELLGRYPHQLSGGQKQRVNIARALVLEPAVLVCDEPLSALDASLQAGILELLRGLQADLTLTILFITHDIGLLPYISQHTAVMYLGQLIEIGPTHDLLAAPRHPYTAGLISSVPTIEEPARLAAGVSLVSGEIPDPSSSPPGCRYHTRCPFVIDRCRTEPPVPTSPGPGRTVSCHRVGELALAGIHGVPGASGERHLEQVAVGLRPTGGPTPGGPGC